MKQRGVFEKSPGSGIWWVQYYDSDGRRRREKAGTKSHAVQLYRKRKTEALQGRKLPETLRARTVKFSELADDALECCKANNLGQQFDSYHIGRLVDAFGTRPADIAVEDLRRRFAEQEWRPATFNRYKLTLSLIYRLGIEHGKTTVNPARLPKRKREDNGRVRFLNQYSPDEDSKLRLAIERDAPSHMAEFEIALHTGMRPSGQYGSLGIELISVVDL
jgi:hypothetical protein